MGFDEITALVKRRYETGEYGSAHFLLARDAWDQARSAATASVEPAPPWRPDPITSLLSIPVRVDEDLPPGEWRLIENGTDKILFRGLIDFRGEVGESVPEQPGAARSNP
jgi:hypothetical protein